MQNELKRTQNEPQLSAEMRALSAEFEFSSTSQVLAEVWNGKEVGVEVARSGESRGLREVTKIVGTKLRSA